MRGRHHSGACSGAVLGAVRRRAERYLERHSAPATPQSTSTRPTPAQASEVLLPLMWLCLNFTGIQPNCCGTLSLPHDDVPCPLVAGWLAGDTASLNFSNVNALVFSHVLQQHACSVVPKGDWEDVILSLISADE